MNIKAKFAFHYMIRNTKNKVLIFEKFSIETSWDAPKRLLTSSFIGRRIIGSRQAINIL